MRLTVILPLAAVMALAGCNNSDTVKAKNESVASVADKVAASNIRPLPGRWETTMKMGKVEMTGMPAGAADAMGKAAPAAPIATCLTPEDAAKLDGSQFRNAGQDCKYDNFSMAGGKVEGVMTCAAGGQTQRVSLNGTYAPEAYDLAISTQMEMQPGKSMTTAMNVSSRRTGDCNGTEMKVPAATPAH